MKKKRKRRSMADPWRERAPKTNNPTRNTDLTNFRSQLSKESQNSAQKKYNMELERLKISKQ